MKKTTTTSRVEATTRKKARIKASSKAQTAREAAVRHLLRTDFSTFARRSFSTSAGEMLSSDRYLEVLEKAAADVFKGEQRRQLIALPPRHGKTSVVTVALAAFELARRPATKVMILSHGEDLARNIADKVRDVMEAPWLQEAFATRIRKGQNRAMDFATTAGGGLYASHLGGSITGRGADLIIVDDPVHIDDAAAPDRLAAANQTFDSVVRNRLNHQNEGRIVVVAHRLHPNDLVGHLLAEGGWNLVTLPLIAQHDTWHDVPTGRWLRRQGELLRAGAFTDVELQAMRQRQSVPDFDTLYQQDPAGASWHLTADDFPSFDVVPADVGGGVLSIDTAHSLGSHSSFSVIQIWRSSASRHFLLAQIRDRVAYHELVRRVRSIIARARPTVVLIEKAELGPALAGEFASRSHVFQVELIPPGPRSKIARFADVVPILKARAVHLPMHAEWRPEYIDELTTFPLAANDDQVDATSQYLRWQSEHPSVPVAPAKGLGIAVTRYGKTVAGERPSLAPHLAHRRYIFRPKT